MILPEALPIFFTTNKLPRCTCVLARAMPVIITQQQWRTKGGGVRGFKPPPPEILKALQNCAKLNPSLKLLKIAEFRMPTHQDVRKKGSKLLKTT